jgi:nucleotide-binding universal stress UspA family protein
VKKVIAALDNSLAAGTVLATAGSLARLFGAGVEALHVREDGAALARREAEAVGLPLRVVEGTTVDALVAEGRAEEVVALVLGARRLPLGGRPVGTTALEVITSLLKPVVVVPPDAVRPGALDRVLVPLEGTISTSLAPKGIIELAGDARLDVVVLHVHDAESLPAFTDQPQHQAEAWGREFLARYCPWGLERVTLELRVGRRAEQILGVAEELQADVIALGWSQELAAGRAPVVREVLERARIPVFLVPVHLAEAASYMVGRGSPVRVRKRDLQKFRKARFFFRIDLQ